MIQRIQSLYLLVVVILMGVMHILPLALVGVGESALKLMVYGVRSGEQGSSYVFYPYLGILVSLSCLLALVILFLYKHRIVQIRLCFAEITLLIGSQILTFYYIFMIHSASTINMDTITYGFAAIIPIICAIFTYLAVRGVIKDESMIRSLNRIR